MAVLLALAVGPAGGRGAALGWGLPWVAVRLRAGVERAGFADSASTCFSAARRISRPNAASSIARASDALRSDASAVSPMRRTARPKREG
ncbi:hypothetical protein [Lysobacter enzymogenes]|uniref:hypothetical protein n=1 Tax=Lysobacter enzymogenes TaxID=69 RepID=UPI001AF86EE6|nr:hypothetical protein [Lysobacter enzymogenes]QQQ03391.1 hypothetical protein JHW41_10775 [Lysobacter enzymogenes]